MIVSESRAGRRLVGRLPRGAQLLDGLLAVCREHGVRTAEIRGVGSLESVEVNAFDQTARAWKPGRAFAGSLHVLGLLGNLSERAGQLALELSITLMRERDNGVEVLGGHVLAGRVFSLEFVIEALDDVLLRRTPDATTGLVLWSEAVSAAPAHPSPPAPSHASPPAPAHPSPPAPTLAPEPAPRATGSSPPRTLGSPPPRPSGPPAPSATTSWAEVARASTARTEEPDDVTGAEHDAAGKADGTEGLEPGDILIHPTFGRCEVQRIEGGYEFAQVRLKNGRLVRLSLDILRVAPAGTEGRHRIFRARVDD